MSHPWPTEDIPDQDVLLMRVYREMARDDQIGPGCFKDLPQPGDGMSTNWSRYSTPAATRAGGPKPAAEYSVIELNVGEVRRIPDQWVVHDPLPHNRAHTLVHGPKGSAQPRLRLMYLRICRVVIPLSQDVDETGDEHAP